jgi:hypothetical protein
MGKTQTFNGNGIPAVLKRNMVRILHSSSRRLLVWVRSTLRTGILASVSLCPTASC